MIGYIRLHFIYKKNPKTCIPSTLLSLKLSNFFTLNYLGEYLTKTCVSGFYFKCH